MAFNFSVNTFHATQIERIKISLVYRVEISSRLSSKLLFKIILQLHVKISTRYTLTIQFS